MTDISNVAKLHELVNRINRLMMQAATNRWDYRPLISDNANPSCSCIVIPPLTASSASSSVSADEPDEADDDDEEEAESERKVAGAFFLPLAASDVPATSAEDCDDGEDGDDEDEEDADEEESEPTDSSSSICNNATPSS
jgi:hypothetical protein